jgi:hypothetical protein
MTTPAPATRYRILVASSLCFASGIVGSVIGRAYAAALGPTAAKGDTA